MQTHHKIFYKDSKDIKEFDAESIHLVVTSPPYPMIAMWDKIFTNMNPKIGKYLDSGDGYSAFKLMHVELKKVWETIFKIIIPGGHVCINIGDATRTINKQFKLYPNHSEIVQQFYDIGFTVLPEIIWRKPSNSPTKFLGSGMLPCGAYVTLEHEHILIFRKPIKREFKKSEEITNRRQSSYFWDERNTWFSDIWYHNGTKQSLNEKKVRKRSGAFPLEVPFRLINMFSSKFDTVFDPFLGTATTTLAAIMCGRNSIGYEIDGSFGLLHQREIPSKEFIKIANKKNKDRIKAHLEHIEVYKRKGSKPKYTSSQYGFPVITKQEKEIKFDILNNVIFNNQQKTYKAIYEPYIFK